ncbi:MAG TPA: ATP-binding protein [Rhodopila sp.]
MPIDKPDAATGLTARVRFKASAASSGVAGTGGQPRPTTLGRQLGWLVVAVVFPMLVFGLAGVALQYRAERANAARDALELARDLGSGLEADLKARGAALQTLALSPLLAAGDLAAFGQQLRQTTATQFPDSTILLWDAGGQVVSDTRSSLGTATPARDPPPNLRQVFVTARPGISDVYTDVGLGRPAITLDVPVLREDGAVAYVLSITPGPSMVADQFHSMPVREGWTVSIADRKGIFIARSKDSDHYVGQRAGAAFFARLPGTGASVAEIVNRKGIPVLLTFRRSEPSGWTVVIGIPRKDLTDPAWHLTFLTLTAGCLLLLLGLALARIFARRIIGPINALQMLSTQENRGTRAAAPFTTGLREVDEVGRTLLKSFTELRESRTELARVNAALESRVAEALAASDAAHERLAQGQKIQALGQLAGGIAHDFNNILQTMTGAATMIERRSDGEERTKRFVRVMLEAASRGASITQRLLSFARRGTLSAEPIATAALLDGVREVLAHTLGSPITVCTATKPDVPRILADRGQLETALINLGVNARDAMPDGGTLTLSARQERVIADSPHPAGLAQGDYVRIAVTDTGTGMDPATLSRVTEPFFTTKPAGVGTGLGLSIVRGFAEQSGGALQIESAPGSGTIVTLWLPQAPDDALALGPRAATEVVAAGKSTGCVLLVDDDDLVRETLVAQLEDLGFTTLAASSGRAAIALLEANEDVVALVCDLAMPDLNGIQTIRAARHRRPELPCFLLTGYTGEHAALAGSDTFTVLRKPLSGGALAAHIEAVLAA